MLMSCLGATITGGMYRGVQDYQFKCWSLLAARSTGLGDGCIRSSLRYQRDLSSSQDDMTNRNHHLRTTDIDKTGEADKAADS